METNVNIFHILTFALELKSFFHIIHIKLIAFMRLYYSVQLLDPLIERCPPARKTFVHSGQG